MDKMESVLENVRSAIERLGGGRDDGEELFAEVSLGCVKKGERYDWSDPRIEGRVIKMARNLRITRFRRDRLRRHARLPDKDCQALACDSGPVEESQAIVCAACREAVESLPDRYRDIVNQYFFAGKRLTSIAREIGLPSATVRTRCRRALQRLARDPRIRELAPIYGRET